MVLQISEMSFVSVTEADLNRKKSAADLFEWLKSKKIQIQGEAAIFSQLTQNIVHIPSNDKDVEDIWLFMTQRHFVTLQISQEQPNSEFNFTVSVREKHGEVWVYYPSSSVRFNEVSVSRQDITFTNTRNQLGLVLFQKQ